MLTLIFLATCAAVALVVWLFLHPKDDILPRRLQGASYQELARARELRGSLRQRVLQPLVARLGTRLGKLLPHNFVRSVERLLGMANDPMSLPAYLGFWGVMAASGVGVLAYIVALQEDVTPLRLLGLSALILPFFLFSPYIILRRRARSRQKRINRALPDALDLLVTGVEAGLGVDAAIAMVTEKTTGPLSEALSLYLKQVGLGRARGDALVYVAGRTGALDLVRLAASITQAEEIGSTLGDALRAQAEELRLARRQRAQEAAQRAPVLMTIPLVLCFLPAMAAVVVVPSMLNLVRFIGGLGNGG